MPKLLKNKCSWRQNATWGEWGWFGWKLQKIYPEHKPHLHILVELKVKLKNLNKTPSDHGRQVAFTPECENGLPAHLNWVTYCNVLGYWRHRSVCYSVYYDFISRHYSLFFTMCCDPLMLCLGAVLVSLLWSMDLLWSASLVAPLISLLWFVLWAPSVISLLCVSSVCVCPFIILPLN
jgi:hypothetical protein